MRVDVTTWHLEMLDPSRLVPASPPPSPLDLAQARHPSPELNRFLYTAVGGDHFWVDRLAWSHADWWSWLDRDELETWVLREGGNLAGYFELEAQPQSDSVELAYFGLLPAWVGRGYGGPLLEAAVRRAWERGPRRVWVHTCSLDHPRARAAYEARGFVLFDEQHEVVELPAESPGPWPGARRATGAG